MTDPSPLTAEKIAELRRLLAEATSGPWAYRSQEYDDWGAVRGPDYVVASARAGRSVSEEEYAAHRRGQTDPYGANARLIVAAVNALPALLALGRSYISNRLTIMREAAAPLRKLSAGESGSLDWAVARWKSEVENRPLVNVHRRSLDDVWRQVIRHFGGDDRALCGPTHDERVADERVKLSAGESGEWQPTHRHYKGGLYRVIARGRVEADLTPCVVYDNAEGETWVRSADDFAATVEVDGKWQFRFDPLPEPPR